MKQPQVQPDWPAAWRTSFDHDCVEFWGSRANLGYTLAYQERFRATLEMVRRVVPGGGTILDIGAAQGNFSLALAEAGYCVTWNDFRADLIDYVKLKYERGTLDFVPGNIFELDFPECFDCVLLTEVIEHVAHPDLLLQRVASLVKPGGYIVLSTPNGGYFRNQLPKFSTFANPAIYESVQFQPDADGHIFLLHPDELVSLSKTANLAVEQLIFLANPLISGHLKLGHLLPYLPQKIVLASQKLIRCWPWLARKISVGMLALLRNSS